MVFIAENHLRSVVSKCVSRAETATPLFGSARDKKFTVVWFQERSAWTSRFLHFQHLASRLARGMSWWCTRWDPDGNLLDLHWNFIKSNMFPSTVVI